MKVITNSMAACYRSCARKCKYRYIDKRRPHKKSDALYLGSVMHEALEWYAPTKNRDRALSVVQDADIDEFAKAKLSAMLHGYHIAFKNDGLQSVVTESMFDVPLVNPATGRASRTWRVQGVVDAVVLDDEGKKWILEHKTTSQDIEPGSVYWQRLRMDSQVSTYFMALDNVEGVLYNVMRKPALKPLLATPEEKRKYNKNGSLNSSQRDKDEDPVTYMTRCMTAIANDPHKYYQRAPILRGDLEQREAAYDLWWTAKSIHQSTMMDVWPRSPAMCFLYNSPCDYFDVCTGVASIDDNLRFRTAETEHEEL